MSSEKEGGVMGSIMGAVQNAKDAVAGKKGGETKVVAVEKTKVSEDSNKGGGILGSMGNMAGAMKEKFTGPNKE